MRQGIFGVNDVMAAALATGLFVSRISFEAPDGLLGPSGAPSGVYVAISGLQRIQCMDAPDSVDRYNIEATDTRTPAEIYASSLRHVLLNRYYSQLSPSTNWGDVAWRARVVNAQGEEGLYDVVGAEPDSQTTQTRVKLLKVTL